MAEAHQAVAFQFTVGHDGVNLHIDNDALTAVFLSGLRSWRLRLVRFKNSVYNGVYPGTASSWLALLAIITAVQFTDLSLATYVKGVITDYFSSMFSSPLDYYLGSLFLTSMIWLSMVFTSKMFLSLLLLYTGFLYDAVKKPSSFTKVWMLLLKVCSGRSLSLYSFQKLLPKLPLPSLKETLQRHLESMKPIVDRERFAQLTASSDEFENGLGRRLQFYLLLKSWWAGNWVTDWWEDYVYLASRSPIMINSNFYGLDNILYPIKATREARAANIIYSLFQMRKMIDRESLQPLLLSGVRPLCSAQYWRAFNTTRIPHLEKDRLIHLPDATHIAVHFRGGWFKLPCYYRGELLKPCEFERCLIHIVESSFVVTEEESRIAAFTGSSRDDWSKMRNKLINFSSENKQSVDIIEKAAFLVNLSDEAPEFDPEDESKGDKLVSVALHGSGCDIWFDKSFTVCAFANARLSVNAEHSWGDAPILSQIFEYCIYQDVRTLGYTLEGHTRGTPQVAFVPPFRLSWKLNGELKEAVNRCFNTNLSAISECDMRLMMFDKFGKGFTKRIGCSADGFLQLALQLAYFRDLGRFDLTYEAAMTRLFREGRTETVRPCTEYTCEFVQALEARKMSQADLRSLLIKTVDNHQKKYREAMTGKGTDRHLFCLYVLSRYMKRQSNFLDEVINEKWCLSTSQTPPQQSSNYVVDWRELHAGGGFNTVAENGYGVSYIISGENCFLFHISSKATSSVTDSSRFRNNIRRALCDLRNLFPEIPTVT